MGVSIKRVGGSYYIETEEAVDVATILDGIDIDDVVDHYGHKFLLELIPDKVIKEYCIQNVLLNTDDCVNAVDDIDELRESVARKIIYND